MIFISRSNELGCRIRSIFDHLLFAISYSVGFFYPWSQECHDEPGDGTFLLSPGCLDERVLRQQKVQPRHLSYDSSVPA